MHLHPLARGRRLAPVPLAQRWIDARSERPVVGLMLVAFVVLWMAFQTVSPAPVDMRDDAIRGGPVVATFRVRLQTSAANGLAVHGLVCRVPAAEMGHGS